MKTETLRADHPVAIPHAVDVLRNGGLVAFPTDTVYGVAALISSERSVERLLAAKGRDSDRAIGVLIGSLGDLALVAREVSPQIERLARFFWPGPLTIMVRALPGLPASLSRGEAIGVRMPNHPLALALLRQSGPLAVSSANLSGQTIATTPAEVLAQMDGRIHLLLDGGPSPLGLPSTVVDCTGVKLTVLRPGPITAEQMAQVDAA